MTGGRPGVGRADRLDSDLRAAIRGLTVRPLWVVFLATAVPFLLGLSVPVGVQYVPLVVSGVVLGLPHGAVDHLVPARVRGVSLLRSAVGVGLVYLVLGGAYLAAWFFAPVAAAVAFVAVTWFHWGQGDVYLLSAVTGGEYPRSIPHRALVLVVRGAMPMAVTLVAHPGQYRRVLADLVVLFEADPATVAALVGPGTRRAVAVVVALVAGASLLRGVLVRTSGGFRTRLDRGARIDLAETAVLGVFFLAVPPILAVGLYFCLWHSLRHVVRLLAVDDEGGRALRAGHTGAALAAFGRDAAPLTVVALVLVAGAYTAVPQSPTGLGEGVALYLVVIAVLTLPHVALVTWMDHRQGVWRRAPPSRR